MIIYPIFFIVPGIVGLVVAASSSNLAWPDMLVLVMFVAAALGRLRFLAILAVGMLVTRLLLSDIDAVTVGLYITSWLLLTTGFAARCPRCETHITSYKRHWDTGPNGKWCSTCGRTRKRVWPFQYALKPEVWDGQYHDEGGGPSSVDRIVDWRRDLRFKFWQRRHRHRP